MKSWEEVSRKAVERNKEAYKKLSETEFIDKCPKFNALSVPRGEKQLSVL